MPFPRDLPGQPEERVVRQLAAALLFEKLVPARCTPDADGLSFTWDRFRCRGLIGPFGRLRLTAGSVQQQGPLGWGPAEPAALLASVPTPAEHKAGLLAELARTVDLCRWNAAHLPTYPRLNLPYAAVDGALDEGHPYHPCFKARLGFSDADHDAYGPEAGHRFQLVWLAVARAALHQVLPGREAAFWAAELGPAWPDLDRRRAAVPGGAAAYGLVPLHPWQWAELSAGALAPWLADGRAVLLGPAGAFYRASQSVRTLMNADDPTAAQVKLALNIVNTASRRSLTPHSVPVAPVISDWLTGIVARDPLFQTRYPLALLPEYAAIIADRDGPLAGQVAAIWRGSVEAALLPGEAAVPFNLLAVTEADGSAAIAPWLDHYGGPAWIKRLIEVAVLPVWHLLVHHGIAVEAHAQNMVLTHRNGWPERLILRDFHESIEYCTAFLREPEAEPPFFELNPAYRDGAPNQYYWSEHTEALRELVMDTLFVFNLTDLSDLLALKAGVPETTFWGWVHAALAAYAAQERPGPRLAALGLDAPEILTESLLTEKLRRAETELHHAVPNILADFSFAAREVDYAAY